MLPSDFTTVLRVCRFYLFHRAPPSTWFPAPFPLRTRVLNRRAVFSGFTRLLEIACSHCTQWEKSPRTTRYRIRCRYSPTATIAPYNTAPTRPSGKTHLKTDRPRVNLEEIWRSHSKNIFVTFWHSNTQCYKCRRAATDQASACKSSVEIFRGEKSIIVEKKSSRNCIILYMGFMGPAEIASHYCCVHRIRYFPYRNDNLGWNRKSAGHA